METMANDDEWVKLVLEARRIGLTIEEIRQFLSEAAEGREKEIVK
ncbi:anti-repressor SinI family protein [Virgibacillus ainsalahensis]